MPKQTFALLIGGVILAAAVTVAVALSVVPLSWALPGAIIAALIARYAIARLMT